MRDNYKLQALGELSKVVSEIVEIETVLPKLSQRVSRIKILAPMDGVISQIKYKTLGGYVQKGDVLLEMVPGNANYVAEAKRRGLRCGVK